MAFLFDTRRVVPSGLACEIVVPEERLRAIGLGAFSRQFARTPYAVSFRSGTKAFILITLHVLYGQGAEERVPELAAIADWLAAWAGVINGWDHNLIASGDFNTDRRGDALHDAVVSTGLDIPEDFQNVPRTVFSDPGRPHLDRSYDQIVWFTGRKGLPAPSLRYSRGGCFDSTKAALTTRGLTKTQLSWRISDRFPLRAESSVRAWLPAHVNPEAEHPPPGTTTGALRAVGDPSRSPPPRLVRLARGTSPSALSQLARAQAHEVLVRASKGPSARHTPGS